MITDLNLFPLRLVHGGTNHAEYSGNMCTESMSMLKDVDLQQLKPIQDQWISAIANPTFELIDSLLSTLADRHISICGGVDDDDSVYSSTGLRSIFKYLHNNLDKTDTFKFNIFPRTGGLREAIIRSIESEEESLILKVFIGYSKNV
jgi:chromosome condensin MukBEF MukE localization factor